MCPHTYEHAHTHAHTDMPVYVYERHVFLCVCSRERRRACIMAAGYEFHEGDEEALTVCCVCCFGRTVAFEFIMDDMCFGQRHQMEESLEFHTCLKALKLYTWLPRVPGLWQSVFDKPSITQVLLRGNLGPHLSLSHLSLHSSLSCLARRDWDISKSAVLIFSACYEYKHTRGNLVNLRSGKKLEKRKKNCYQVLKILWTSGGFGDAHGYRW